MNWQPIETAPKDGTAILLFFPSQDVVIRGCWAWQGEGDWESGIQDFQDWGTDDDLVINDDPYNGPTHWMPLPEPPK